MSDGLEIPYDVADAITLVSLSDNLRYLKEETRLHLEENKYIHPEDLPKNIELIKALELLVVYYGGEI